MSTMNILNPENPDLSPSKITLHYPSTTDIPMSAVLQSARRLLMECDKLDVVAIIRTGQVLDITATVSKVKDSGFSYHIVEDFEAVMHDDKKVITPEQKTEESGG